MISLKICGMKFPDNIQEIAGLQPDYLGFIFYKDSARNFEAEIPKLREGIKPTGVFVNASFENILEKVRKHDLRAVQLHGDETPGFCLQLMEKLQQEDGKRKVEILKVFSVDDQFHLSQIAPFEGCADYFLFDSKGKERGGNGIRFNWDLLLEYNSPTPFFLSGGIGTEETEEIKNFITQLHHKEKIQLLHGIDVNSRFESEPGRKKLQELQAFKEEISAFLKNKNYELPR